MTKKYPIFLCFFLYSIFIFSIKILAEQFKYEHATVKTKSGIEIPVEVADTFKKRSLGLGNRLACFSFLKVTLIILNDFSYFS